MSKKELTGAGKRIADKLIKIREEIGVPTTPFSAKKQVMSASQFRKISSKIPVGKLLVIDGKISMVYIKDHLFWSESEFLSYMRNAPNKCFMEGKRVHFYMCSTLKEMEKRGRSARYCIDENLDENECEIDLKEKDNIAVRLGWCKNCLEILLNDGNVRYRNSQKRSIQHRASINGDSKEILDCITDCYHENDDRFGKIRQFFQPFMEG